MDLPPRLQDDPTSCVCSEDFHNLQQEDLSVHNYCCRLKRLADTLTDVGHPITDRDLVVNTMRGLSSKFSNVLGIINAMNPLPSFLWVHSYLLQEETRVERSHKMEVANTLLIAGASTGAVWYHSSRHGRHRLFLRCS
jgi:hypothetical protein